MSFNGITYMHEHVYIDLSHLKTEDSRLDCLEQTIAEFKYLKQLGTENILEVTNIGMGRNLDFMQEVQKQSGIKLFYCTGFYQEMFHPPYLKEMSEKEIYQLFIKEITTGMDDTNIKASAIGEIGSSKDTITKTEEKIFRASIKAHLDTGAALTTHCSLGTMGHEQIQIFQEYTKDLSHIVIGHTDLTGNKEYIQYMLDQGVNIAFDTIGKWDYMSDEWRINTLYSLINKGYQDQIVLSLDITRKSHLKSFGGLGYAYLLETFIPLLREKGIHQQAIDAMLTHNPQKILQVSRFYANIPY
ncbi:MAG: phosphotriesterase family protein [Brevinema sp.]